MTDKDISFLVRLAAVTVCFIVAAMVVTMLAGLFHPSVDNQEVFKIIGPAFSGVVGCLTTVIGAGRYVSGDEER